MMMRPMRRMERRRAVAVVGTAAAPAGGSDITAQLEQLSQMHNAGVLSDEEFAAAKQKALAGG